ncbi:MAG: GDYXXLXY domain-containing protein [Pseudomonadota bacterium]
MKQWRAILIWGGLLCALLVANFAIRGHERTLSEGRVLLLELAPVDPRSLMQGDYMALRFAAAEDVREALYPDSVAGDARMLARARRSWTGACGGEPCRDGYAVFALEKDGVGRFVRVQKAPAPVGHGELAVRFRERGWHEIRIASDAWFFEEGQAKRYEPARFGELRVAKDGTALLTGLRDERRKRL